VSLKVKLMLVQPAASQFISTSTVVVCLLWL